jgi:hypothetical protein
MMSANYRTNAAWRRLLAGIALVAVIAGCGSSGKHSAPPPSTTAAHRPTPTTLPAIQTSGLRTVLSPIGLNVRAAASTSARKVGTAAWGTVVTVLGHTDANGGWYEVKGATRTGWIDGDPTLSARGEFAPYSSGVHLFSALYPPTWTFRESPPSSVVFRSGSGTDTIVATMVPTDSRLPQGRAGYGESGIRTVVVCGVTGALVSYTRASAAPSPPPARGATLVDPYLLQIRLTLDPHHFLGIYGNLSSLGVPVQEFTDFVLSVTFPTKQCIG